MDVSCILRHVPAERYGGEPDTTCRRLGWTEYERTLCIAGSRLHFVDIGEGQIPVVLLHGHGSTWQYWTETILRLAAEGRRVIAVDLPGFGRSQAHPFATSSMSTLVEALRELLDTLQVGQCDLVGHSFGTILGIELAARHGTRVRTLALAGGPASSIVALFQRPVRTAIRRPGLTLTVLGDMCTAGLPIPTMIRRFVAHRKWLRWMAFSSYVHRPGDLDADTAEMLMLGVGAPGYFHLPLKAHRFVRASAGQVCCPVLVVNGDRDAFVPGADVQDFLQEVPHARAHTIVGAGHLVTVEYPLMWVALLCEFHRMAAVAPTRIAAN